MNDCKWSNNVVSAIVKDIKLDYPVDKEKYEEWDKLWFEIYNSIK